MNTPEMKIVQFFVSEFLVFCKNTAVGRVERSDTRFYVMASLTGVSKIEPMVNLPEG